MEERMSALEEKVEAREEDASSLASPLNVYWDGGLRIDSADKKLRFRVGGRIQIDFAFFSEDDDLKGRVGDSEDGIEFRRSRLFVSGTMFESYIFKAQYDFAGGDADFKDVYVGLEDIPYVGRLRVGQFYEPFNLDELTSDNYITFLERSLANVFTPSRHTGIGLNHHLWDKRATWSLGGFRETNSSGDVSDDIGGYAATARVTGLPWFENEEKLLHVGLAYSYRHPLSDRLRYSQRPEAHLATRYVDTGDMVDVDRVNLAGAEVAVVLGPLSLQSEFIHSWVESDFESNPRFFGYYVQVSYFVTGEHRAYSTSSGTFGRIEPMREFLGAERGPGAVELGLRYSYLDLDDENVSGGKLKDITAGINWYLNRRFRVMANYIYADLDGPGEANIFEMRFQVDF
ncbi:MAG: porin [Planctomycetota bacterium]|nr:porin [Planctomycetota bacterium]